MSELTNSSDIARETLRLLAARRLSPTPDNYRQHYEEICGQPQASSANEAELMLQRLAAELGAPPCPARSAAAALDQAAAKKDWDRYRTLLLELIEAKSARSTAAADWAELILELLRQWEMHHSGLTPAKKRETLEKLLGTPGADSALLARKLKRLLKSWSALAPTQDAVPAASETDGGATPAPLAAAVPAEAGAALGEQLRELLAQTLEFAVVSQLQHAPDLAEQASELARVARAATQSPALANLASSLHQFWFKLEARGGDNAALHQGLLRLLRLLIDNTHELLGEDQWLRGQVAVVKEIVSRPLDLQAIAEAERRLKDVIVKQSALRSSLAEAKSALKQLITSFIDRLGELCECTDDYHSRLGTYAQKIRQSDDIKTLNVVLDELLQDTRTAQANAARTREELLASRRQVEAAERKVRQLEQELEQVSGLVQEDQLTGVLNRRGLDDAYQREAARADRAGSPLCVGLLDIDNFKQLNDAHGHQTGDDALQHLVRVTRRTMRPTDVLARYGGEEFMLLLPETELDEAVDVMVRLQRNLTKAFFLHNNERVLITFSAGVTRRLCAEAQVQVVERADKALYSAKRDGKNRVRAI